MERSKALIIDMLNGFKNYYLKNGDKENARKEFETALKINPDDYFARHFLDSISDPGKTIPH